MTSFLLPHGFARLTPYNSTGITGYIGGSVFAALVERHPEYAITAFVRKTPEGFEAKFPQVNLVHGTWDDAEILKKAASEADIIIQCGNSDHTGAVTALLEGAASGKEGKGYYIHLSGTGLIADFLDPNGKEFRGKLNPKVYDDLENVEEVLNRPDGTPHRHTDKIIQEAGSKHSSVLGTAIVAPPDIYGKGTGPVKVESVYFPAFIGEAKKVGATFYYGEGENRRGWTSVGSVVEVFVRLVEEAVKGGGSATWGREVCSCTDVGSKGR
jgi:nucleoside-diphosphate-sugar epimerase